MYENEEQLLQCFKTISRDVNENNEATYTKANYIQITFNDSENSPIAYEMLEGLRTGRNITWGLAYQQNLANNLTVSINYDGRQSQGSNVIHTGGMQVRAYF